MRKNKIGLKYKIHLEFPKGLPVKLIIIIIAFFLGILFSTLKLIKFLRATDYFKVRDIVFNEESRLELSHLKGQNIFTVDLRQVSRYIIQHCPIYRNARVVRVLPNRIFVNFTRRQPLAAIKLYRYFYVDREAVLFDALERFLPQQDLPIILGLEKKVLAPKLGARYNIRELIIALNIIKGISLNKVFKEYKLKKIYVDSLNNISFFMLAPLLSKDYPYGRPAGARKELEIKMDAYNLKSKLSILAGLLSQVRDDLANIKYIDLRFKEPVIKFNEAQTYGTK